MNLPYPEDTVLPTKDSFHSYKDCLLYEDENSSIFNLQHLLGCSSKKFAIFRGTQISKKYFYSIHRWDNMGGWQRIYSDMFFDINEAKKNLIPIAKYFV